jgi:flavodoxin
MQALVVYFTKFGHTQRVAEAIAAGLGGARLAGIDDLQERDLEGIDLLVMGSPTHNMNLPEAVKPYLEQVPKRALRGKLVAAFDTSYELSRWLQQFTAGRRLDRWLRKLGGRRLAAPEIFIVDGREGPLREGELERARAWAAAMKSHLVALPA